MVFLHIVSGSGPCRIDGSKSAGRARSGNEDEPRDAAGMTEAHLRVI
jgi:hypothetical protein